MAKVRNLANTLRKGRIGENSWYVRNGEQIVRQSRNNSNYGEEARRTEAQQDRRARWGNLVNFYKACRYWMPKAFETKAQNQSEYNKFVSLNINHSDIYLTKSQVEMGGCVPWSYIVAQGSLDEVVLTNTSPITALTAKTNLRAGNVGGEEMTWGDVSGWLIDNNRGWAEGDNFAVVVFDLFSDNDVPRTVSRYYEFQLDKGSTISVADLDGILFRKSSDGFIEIEDRGGDQVNEVALAVIHTRIVDSVLKVSQSRLFLTSNRVDEFTGDPQVTDSINSYGLDSDVPLAPGV